MVWGGEKKGDIMGMEERLERELHLQIKLFFRKMKTLGEGNIVKCKL